MRSLIRHGCAAVAVLVVAVLLAACTSGKPARTGAPSAGSGPASVPASGAPAQAGSTGAPGTSGTPPPAAGSGASTTGRAGGRKTTPPSPVRAEDVRVLGDCSTPSVRPVSIVVTCADAGIVLEDLRWTQWDDTSAVGTASLTYNECRPNCAQGHNRTVRDVGITLTAPVASPFGFPLWSVVTLDPAPQGFGRTLALPTRPVG